MGRPQISLLLWLDVGNNISLGWGWHAAPTYGSHHTVRSYILCQIMVTFLSYISNACHSLSGVAERLQHTLSEWQCGSLMILGPSVRT